MVNKTNLSKFEEWKIYKPTTACSKKISLHFMTQKKSKTSSISLLKMF
ncbi:hypothetical protein BN1088_50001 [Sphingobacterium sp. PM2-P1-29]|nr:hypothetical protein BN1088_50001 [Sphingobacterium sp. PM2-P1-29]